MKTLGRVGKRMGHSMPGSIKVLVARSGGESTAIVISLIESAKLTGVQSWASIEDILIKPLARPYCRLTLPARLRKSERSHGASVKMVVEPLTIKFPLHSA